MTPYFTFFATIISLMGFAQQITGTLKNNSTEAVPFANILLFNASDSSLVSTAITDSSGYFEMVSPSSSKQYYLLMQAIGMQDFKSDSFAGTMAFGEIKMIKSTTALGTVNIVVKKPIIQQTGRGLIMNVSSSPILENSSGKEILEKIPGTKINQDGSISLKGKQNVQIFMDGKPSNMSREDLMRLLANMPASEIEKIEVFEIPPAKYDASGGAGVINVVTKRGSRLGLNGYTGIRVGYGNFHKLSGYSGVNYRNKKFNAFGSGWYYNNMSDHFATADIHMEIDGENSSFLNDFHRISHPIGFGTRGGIDVFLNDKTTLGYIGLFYNGKDDGWEPSTVTVTGPATSNYDFIDAIEDYQYFWSGHTHNINLQSKLRDNETVNIDLDFAMKNSGTDNNNLNSYYKKDSILTPFYIEQKGITNTIFGVVKIDYENTIFSDVALETGAKSSWVQTDNDFTSFNGTNTSDLTENLNASNTFKYDEIIISGYASLAKKWGERWTADAGLRIEHTNAIGVSPTTSSNFERNYTNYFPNVALNYSIPTKYNISGAYTRRIDRPKYYQLNPFQTQTNQFNFHQGNPELQPQISDVGSITYGLRDAFFFTLSASHMKGLMNQVINQEEALERQVHITENLDKFENYSLNAYLPFAIKKGYRGHFNGTLFYNKMSSDLKWGVVGYDILTFSLSMQHVVSLPKKLKLELSGYYNHDSYWNIWFVEPHYQLDFGISKSLGNLKLNLIVKDFLNIREGNGGVFQGDVYMPNTYKPESRMVLLSANYRFGNQKVKESRQRKTGSEDIQNRSEK